ncbi:Tricetin 3' 4' 5'-O-trimethyltransferase [Bienertia sinuspersici]
MVHGMNAFEYPSLDTRFNVVFTKAMAQSVIVVRNIFNKYRGLENSNVKQLVDVGGGLGHSVGFITSRYPSIKGIKDAPPTPGVEHVGGDMFESVAKGDSIFLKSDDCCLTLLKNCYKALQANGKIIVVEVIVNDEPETTRIAQAISQ